MALTYPSKVEQFYFVMKQVGGEAIFLEKEENVNDFIKKAYPYRTILRNPNLSIYDSQMPKFAKESFNEMWKKGKVK